MSKGRTHLEVGAIAGARSGHAIVKPKGPVTQQELGRRLRAAREACRLTQDDAAKKLGVSRPTFVQIEAGRRSVSSLELDKLAFLFGRDIREFVSDSFHEEDALSALFRAETEAVDGPAVLEKLRECMALGRELTNLERLVGIDRDLSTVATYSFPACKTRWEAIQQGQRLAEEERRRLDLGHGPLADLSETLESQGVRTGLVDLPDDISGLTLSDRAVGLFVVANRSHHYHRRRFSFAHEYAHVVADRDRSGLISRASERDDLVEVRANAFAANFLMPEDGVRQFVGGLGKGKPSRAFAEVFDEAGSVNVEGRSEPGDADAAALRRRPARASLRRQPSLGGLSAPQPAAGLRTGVRAPEVPRRRRKGQAAR